MQLQTPVHDLHVSLGARMAPFAGWDMPIQYSGIITEHMHTRQVASLFDTCHMGEFELSGPTAEADLERLLTMRVSTIREGQCRYGFLLREDGGVLDDLTCYRKADGVFMLVVNAGTRTRDAEWIRAHLSAQTVFTNRSDELAKLDVQGPTAREETERALGVTLPDLKFFHFTEVVWDGMPCLVSRSGYTGEWGYELYFPAGEAQRIWNQLTANSQIKPAGLGARDTLRLEVGYPLYGHELTEARTPVAAVGKSFMSLDKDFIGSETVRCDLEQGVAQRLVGLRLDSKRAAREGDVVYAGEQAVGAVTSGSMAPSLNVAVAMAYVDQAHCEPETELTIDVRGKKLPASVVTLPFYTEGSARR